MTRKLLVADDSITIQTVVSLTFAEEDIEIETVASGDQVLEKARRVKPDIILADVFMPGQNGYEVCQSIKSDPELRDIPVVLMVGAFEPFDRNEAERVKSNACLTKPFDTNELIQTVRSLMVNAQQKSGVLSPKPEKGQAVAQESKPQLLLEPLISERTRSSFLGGGAVLDLFAFPSEAGAVPGSSDTRREASMPHDILRSVVEDVVRQLCPDIVREVAWEVVPDLSEMLIRQKLSENIRTASPPS